MISHKLMKGLEMRKEVVDLILKAILIIMGCIFLYIGYLYANTKRYEFTYRLENGAMVLLDTQTGKIYLTNANIQNANGEFLWKMIDPLSNKGETSKK